MDTTNIELTPEGYLKAMMTVHFALIAGLLIFGVLQLLITQDWVLSFAFEGDLFFFLVPSFAILAQIISQIINKKKIESLKSLSGLKEKLTGYQNLNIRQIALIEGPAMFGIVIFMITTNAYYLIISGILVLQLISLRPSKMKIENELALSDEHKLQFSKSDEVIL